MLVYSQHGIFDMIVYSHHRLVRYGANESSLLSLRTYFLLNVQFSKSPF